MRTTLNLDDDALEKAKAMVAWQHKPLGEVVSGLQRRAVEIPAVAPKERNGMPLFPVSQGVRLVTPEVVKARLADYSEEARTAREEIDKALGHQVDDRWMVVLHA